MNEQCIISRKDYTELDGDDERILGLFDPTCEPRPRYRTPALVNNEPVWVIDSSNMHMQEMLNWRQSWENADFDHGAEVDEYAGYTEDERRGMARCYAVEFNTDFQYSDALVYYTDDTIEEIIDIIVGRWDRTNEYLLNLLDD